VQELRSTYHSIISMKQLLFWMMKIALHYQTFLQQETLCM